MVTITKTYRFESAHFLPKVPDGHRCGRVHGHNYRVDVSVSGEPDERGWVIDFYELDQLMKPIIAALDHRCLNDIMGLENPTCEILCHWIWLRLNIPDLERVEVWENEEARCSYSGK